MMREELKQLLTRPYDREAWRGIIQGVFPHCSFHAVPQDIPCDKHIVESFRQIGDVRLTDGKNLALFEIHVSDKVKLHRNRVELREIVARYIDQQANHGVLVLFDSHSQDFRFTFAAKETEFSPEGELVERETAAKRFTYILGPHEPCRTAAERFYELAQKKETAKLEDVIEAFSVEKLNKEFFQTYIKQYELFRDYLLLSKYSISVFNIDQTLPEAEKTIAEKPVRDFAKKLLGRIVFLHYLQKKGWLGCPANKKDWKDGDRKFLGNYFEQCEDKPHFHSRYLRPLFHEALNKRDRPNDIFEPTGTRIPYLNGGLFEDDLPQAKQIDFLEENFKQLLEFFGQYNFTIDENDPEDHEVGIDPEMLGHLFENLLEDNKDKGAYYTPKAIVQYMCRQSLIEYLKTHLGDHKELEELVHLKSRSDENDRNIVFKKAREIEQLLDQIKICDPAIGSGAFPIGMLQEIYWIKLTLNWGMDRAKVKREIIQNSIYGVDIDAGAVEIARLRFWLALVVDEDEPRPLPNLDDKIMQGNSLLESFEGIRLDRILEESEAMAIQVIGDDQLSLNLKRTDVLHFKIGEKRRQDIKKLIDEYFTVIDPERKLVLHKEIDRNVLNHIDYNITKQHEITENEFLLAEQELKDRRRRVNNYRPAVKELKNIERLKNDLAQLIKKKEKLHELEEKPERPFFLWHLYFQDVFDKGGFDIVIANPPFVRHETIKEQKPDLKLEFDTFYLGTADLFTYFYKKSLDLLKENGALCFISSNKYFKAGYGKNLRVLIKEKTTPKLIIDFGELPVFAAGTDPSIILLTKQISNDCPIITTIIKNRYDIPRVKLFVQKNGNIINKQHLKNDGWSFEEPKIRELIGKIVKRDGTLEKYVNKRFYRGVLTGLNEAFVIDKATKDQLIEEDKSSEEVIKPFLNGRDVKRWRAESQDLWLIYIPWHFPYQLDNTISGMNKETEKTFKHNYPAIYKHLQKHKEKLLSRNVEETNIRYEWYALQRWGAEYWTEFEKPKLVFNETSKEFHGFYDDKSFYPNKTLFFICGENLRFILSLLCSKLFDFIYRVEFPTWGDPWEDGRIQFRSDRMALLPIPAASPEKIALLEDLVKKVENAFGQEQAELEKKIDGEIYKLFALTEDEIKLVESKTALTKNNSNKKIDSLSNALSFLKERCLYFSHEITEQILLENELNSENSTLKTYLSNALSDNLIYSAGKGWYSGIKEPFELDTKPVKKILTLLKKDFPLLDFQCWSTAQINTYTQHLLARHITFVYTESDAISTVAENLRSSGYSVFANPNKAEIAKTFRVDEKTVVVRPAISKQPQGEDHVAPIEKILVDLVIEAEALKFMDESEAHLVADNATAAGRVLMAELLGYAKRRVTDFSWLKTINQVQKNN
jgi:hypothetical protein